ncbi:ribose-5-phosphate isomerase RpiA [Leeuwenhoekiella marinoflava]|uniref:Ribose-5-phosphate isomerase A n=2 Tax=Leeuwenhoekiella marinoflava TaxID=988 RepID=A0A4Q0PMJ5_9FLAO|nr:ribose-5-phosphate isomerase RpiA [Leeuwenhoekiella marinoflava]RXG30825.1 ribose-5-phosphate isomerase [Leeuwenhoekiella marinoflava]SHF15253.1 ribose-5-phosphate isomerase [Leeuwenhoekiella marinoflava DSM 3653]
MTADQEKKQAALEAVKYIKDTMVVGLGTGSTAKHMIEAVGKLVADGMNLTCVPSSEATEKLAKELGIKIVALDAIDKIDVTIDGADEFDEKFQLIKGGGGALLREKILAWNTKFNIIIADSRKEVQKLGAFKLPVEVIPFATKQILAYLETEGLQPVQRMRGGDPYRTDENNNIIDIDIFRTEDLQALESKLLKIPGVVETGLFLDTTSLIIVGKEGGPEVKERR